MCAAAASRATQQGSLDRPDLIALIFVATNEEYWMNGNPFLLPTIDPTEQEKSFSLSEPA